MDVDIFTEGTRRLRVNITGFDRDTGQIADEGFAFNLCAFTESDEVEAPYTFSMGVDDAARLHSLLDGISIVRDRSVETTGRFLEVGEDVPISDVRRLVENPEVISNPELVRRVVGENLDLVQRILETEITATEIQSLAYRRDQLAEMKRLLEDETYFKECEANSSQGGEAVWQAFFERNQWIFGFALSYVIGEGVQPGKLEQVVVGSSIAGPGKRADALLSTRGAVRSLCYIEIKRHDTSLLAKSEYRPGVWCPSSELVGAVAQSQRTVQLAVEHLQSAFSVPAGQENAGQLFHNVAPRSVVVCGSLSDLSDGAEMKSPRFEAFELYRRNVFAPEVLTFDELHQRAAAIVEARLSAQSSSDRGDEA